MNRNVVLGSALLIGTLFPQAGYAGSFNDLAASPSVRTASWIVAADIKKPGEQGRENESGRVRKGPRTLLEALLGSEWGPASTGAREEEKRLDPDRPHFPEASTTVGKGRVVLESGYTFNDKGSSFRSHSYPEALLRAGMFAEWFELRLGQTVLNQQQTEAGVRKREAGAQDLYAGTKLALSEQKGYLPEIALIPQMTVPTGSRSVTAGRVLPGLNVDCGWEVIKDLFTIELLIATNRVRDDVHRSHVEVATGLTAAADVTHDLVAFAEWDAFYPAGSSRSATGARHYAVAGLVYFVTKNVAVDARTGVGLNRSANDFLAGAGFSIRY